MDFRMDKASWGMLVFMLGTYMYFVVEGADNALTTGGYIQAFGFALLTLVVLVAVSCIPVIIVCYIINKIPDIDYSIWFATAFTIVGIISEVV